MKIGLDNKITYIASYWHTAFVSELKAYKMKDKC